MINVIYSSMGGWHTGEGDSPLFGTGPVVKFVQNRRGAWELGVEGGYNRLLYENTSDLKRLETTTTFLLVKTLWPKMSTCPPPHQF